MHVNYAALALMAAWGRGRRVALFTYAAEMDIAWSGAKARALQRTGTVFAISDFSRQKTILRGAAPERTHVLLLGAPDPCPNYVPRAYPAAPRVVLFVGRMDEHYKGQATLIAAMVRLRVKHPDLHLKFIGGGQTLDYWRAEALRQGVADRVTIAGRVDEAELQEAYRMAAVFAMPSENEGFGLVYVEAMAYGVPCISGREDAAREIVEHEATGLCIPTNDPAALADAIDRLLADREAWAHMSAASRERYLTHFTTAHYTNRLSAAIAAWQARN